MTMRALMYCGNSGKGALGPDGRQTKGVRFQSIVNVHSSLLRTNPTALFGYLWWQERTADPAEWGKVELIAHPELPNAVWVKESVPSLPSMGFGAIPTVMGFGMLKAFSQEGGQYPVDVLFNGDMVSTHVTALALSPRSWSMPAVVRFENNAGPQGHGIMEPLGGDLEALTVAGRLNVATLFINKAQRTAHSALLRKYLTPTVVKGILDRSLLQPNGIDVAHLEALALRVPGPTRRTVGYFGAQATNKGADTTVAVYERLFRAGKVDEALFTAMTPGNVTPPSWAQAEFGLGREYLERARRTKVMVYACKDDGSVPLSVLEAMAVGVVVVQLKKPYAEGMYPPDYPFFFEKEEEAAVLADRALKEYEAWSPKVRAWVRDQYDERRTGPAIARWAQGLCEANSRVRTKDTSKLKFLNELQAVVRAAPEWRWSALWPKLKEFGVGMMGPMLSMADVRVLVEQAGYVDTLTDADARLVKVNA